MHIPVALSVNFCQTRQRKACNLNMSWSVKLQYIIERGIREPFCVSTYLLLSSLKPVAFPRTTTQAWRMKGGKQQGRHNNGPLWKPSGNSEMTQRASCRSLAFPRPQREPVPAGLDCQTCRDAYWLTHCRQGVELGGSGTNRSDNSQQRGIGHGDRCCMVKGWWS